MPLLECTRSSAHVPSLGKSGSTACAAADWREHLIRNNKHRQGSGRQLHDNSVPGRLHTGLLLRSSGASAGAKPEPSVWQCRALRLREEMMAIAAHGR